MQFYFWFARNEINASRSCCDSFGASTVLVERHEGHSASESSAVDKSSVLGAPALPEATLHKVSS